MTIDENFLRRHPHLSKWDERFIKMSMDVANWSKDPKRKVGCVLVQGKRDISKGYNGLPEGLSDDFSRLLDPEFKGKVILHAEANAIINAGKFGVRIQNSTAYITFHPCSSCASMLIQSGIEKIVCPPPLSEPDSKWKKDHNLSSNILFESGIPVFYYTLD